MKTKTLIYIVLIIVIVIGGALINKNQSALAPAITPEPPIVTPVVTPADSPVSGTWTWENTTMNDGSVTTPKQVDAFTITFANDGQVSGTTDCNNFSGSYQQPSPGQITIGPLASTKKFCEDSQEAVFLKAIQSVDQYILRSEILTLNVKFDSGNITFKK